MNEGDIAQQRPNNNEAGAPQQCTQGIEQQEFAVGVARNSRGQRNEGSHEGDETTNHQRPTTVITEVVLGLLQVLGLQYPRIRLEELAPPLRTQEVTNLRANEGCNNNHDDQGWQVQAQSIVQQTCCEEQRFSGKNREKNTRLDKDDEHRPPQNPRSHCNQQAFGVFKPVNEGVKP